MLHDFAKADEAWLDDLLRGISDGAGDLAGGDAGRFSNAVALRVAPPRSSKTAAAKISRPAANEVPPPDTRSALQKLMDRFR